jgi:hypothetical protein
MEVGGATRGIKLEFVGEEVTSTSVDTSETSVQDFLTIRSKYELVVSVFDGTDIKVMHRGSLNA